MSTTITGLPNASTPLDGTERVPMDQAGVTVDATTQAIADLAPGTDLSYNASTRQLSSSTGQGATLPLAGAEAGLMAAADKGKLDEIQNGAEANVNADWNATSGDAAILNKPTLGTAAAAATTDFATAAQGAKADTAVQPAGLTVYVQTGDARLSDSREWIAATIDQAEAEAGTATTRRAFTAQRVFQAIAAWWAASSAKTKLDGIASGATNTPLSDATPQSPGTAAAGTSSSAARGDHVHSLPAVATTTTAGLMPASSFAAITYAADVELDMATLDGQVRTISLTGNLSLTSANRAAGRSVTLRIIADGTQRTLTFPSGWVFIGSKPANIAASKTGVLSLTFFGTASTDAVAAWGVQA